MENFFVENAQFECLFKNTVYIFIRMSPVALQKQSFSIDHNSSASFVLPSLGPNVLPLDEPVDVRVRISTY